MSLQSLWFNWTGFLLYFEHLVSWHPPGIQSYWIFCFSPVLNLFFYIPFLSHSWFISFFVGGHPSVNFWANLCRKESSFESVVIYKSLHIFLIFDLCWKYWIWWDCLDCINFSAVPGYSQTIWFLIKCKLTLPARPSSVKYHNDTPSRRFIFLFSTRYFVKFWKY